MTHVILTETSKCGFTVYAKVKDAPFACKQCGSRKFRTELTMTAEAYPGGSTPDEPRPVIYADMIIYAVTVQCSKCDLRIPGSGYTH